MTEHIKYIPVWSGWLRLSHWVIGFGVLFQIASAWAMANDYSHYPVWRDWHLIIGQLVLAALLLRIALLFTAKAGNWRSFILYPSQWPAALQTLKFYFSFTRFPLPGWYAHNPLWKPLYLLLLVLLALSAGSGLMLGNHDFLAGLSMRQLHLWLAGIITALSTAHIVTVFLHDWKAKGAFVSAMINGHRYFHYDTPEQAQNQKQQGITVSFQPDLKPGSDKQEHSN